MPTKTARDDAPDPITPLYSRVYWGIWMKSCGRFGTGVWSFADPANSRKYIYVCIPWLMNWCWWKTDHDMSTVLSQGPQGQSIAQLPTEWYRLLSVYVLQYGVHVVHTTIILQSGDLPRGDLLSVDYHTPYTAAIPLYKCRVLGKMKVKIFTPTRRSSSSIIRMIEFSHRTGACIEHF